ncbi:MgtC/SapB family protein [Candidatus Nitrosarchaeum limnium]|jgi:putative Mg2+ transporter-C (MgtC) family protein|uniref:Membrane protein, MgtC / SapB family protein n=1 Tax=Candidatus Nitrosarchaeum limnium BG20 TaxID=859192 RepID=S2E190_9ARCH|nr:MgtC/SapB family protein [Candidatus Nitrosarchaeum limnium]EPA04668.1 membrane protein, MgtC / SapB family protein [Candidatus Nitrosarchaeum limnium BG20]
MNLEDSFLNFDFETMVKLLLAVGLGAIIGFERELKHRPAGLRTHMLVSLGATVFTVISLSFDVDPARIAAGIVTGIGFLGAGNIIAQRGHIRGVTSAATLWVVAGIGLCVGVGQYAIAVISALLVFAILQLGRIEKRIDPENKEYDNL